MYSGSESKTSIVEVVVTPSTAIAGVTPTVTRSPASVLNPMNPMNAPTPERFSCVAMRTLSCMRHDVHWVIGVDVRGQAGRTP